MRKIDFNETLVKEYYESEFADHLMKYFDIITGYDKKYPIVLFMDNSFNHNVNRIDGNPAGRLRLLESSKNGNTKDSEYPNETTQNFIFSGILLHMILAQQAINTVAGKKAEELFHICTGWPSFSAGLAGTMLNPIQMIKEASLSPIKEECENYIRMLNVVSPFMIKELVSFLQGESVDNLDNDAYTELKTLVNGKIDQTSNWIKDKVYEIENSLQEK